MRQDTFGGDKKAPMVSPLAKLEKQFILSTGVLVLGLCIVVYRAQRSIWRIDMEARHGRSRRLFREPAMAGDGWQRPFHASSAATDQHRTHPARREYPRVWLE